ncbi:golgin subfamily A member 1-like [Cynoglossus semilaevis]|uniref:golgin subfamily A member 1-like n=1 Tax=Cynoglossus semilaevis TaxID=244447 RepID=UPI000D62E6C8|nr:golgin subfamily A member 1-like [Cynoglossus semilaevis]
MFAKLKNKLAEEAAMAPRSGVRIPRTISKESITSVGADSGNDFASDGSSSRDNLLAQILRRNSQIWKLEAKLSGWKHPTEAAVSPNELSHYSLVPLSFHKTTGSKYNQKLQEQNESHQAGRAKMAEGMTLALEKKDEEWMEKFALVEKEKNKLSTKLQNMMEQSATLLQKWDDLDKLEGFQQQELAKVKHILLINAVRRKKSTRQREECSRPKGNSDS